MPDFTWPKPWLLQLYARAVDEGCIRIRLRGADATACEAEYKSFKAAFLRCRRKRDASYVLDMRPEFSMVTVRFERDKGSALLLYDALPDGELLPAIESVDEKQRLAIAQPTGSTPHETAEEEPDDFDPTSHVRNLIDRIDFEGEDDGESGETTSDL